MSAFVRQLRLEARAEAKALLRWWAKHLPDEINGGFVGEVSAAGVPLPDAPKSIILNTRLLWFFSAMAGWLGSEAARMLADRAFVYVRDHFIDRDHGGVYWLLDARGQVIDAKKQCYALAFAVYALSEYARLTGDATALHLARQLRSDIEAHFRDEARGGYIEALTAFWSPVADPRLSDKDLDAPKTMNTHLHVLEAYTALHRVAPDAASGAALSHALEVFVERFAADGRHLRLFFDMDWTDRTQAVSFGHDIEASWLMWEAAEALGDRVMLARVRPLALGLAEATLQDGVTPDGGLAYERRFDGHVDRAGEWWGQAEALIGLLNAWQLTGDSKWLDAMERLWAYLRAQFGLGGRDEWTWYATDADRQPQVRAGMWKCPYHNGRAMMELDRRLRRIRMKRAA